MPAFYTHKKHGHVTAVYGGREGEEITISAACRTCGNGQWVTYKLPAPIDHEADGTPLFKLTPDHKVCCARTIRQGTRVNVTVARGGLRAWERGTVRDVCGTFVPHVPPAVLVHGDDGGMGWFNLRELERVTGRDPGDPHPRQHWRTEDPMWWRGVR